MSEADKLFEELGYIIEEQNEYYVKYGDEDYKEIWFWKRDETINTTNEITMQELKVINMKVKELRLGGINVKYN